MKLVSVGVYVQSNSQLNVSLCRMKLWLFCCSTCWKKVVVEVVQV
jgi:hypothetical protein